MRIYKVGGAVRDCLLGVIPNDIDYVVVGSTEEEMLSLGYKKIDANNFPVFKGEDNCEYSLARKDIKVSKGYTGFECIFDPNTTLEEDLERRDITINSIAFDLETNTIIDPFNGIKDLCDKLIRHTSPAFSEDPLRVLRAARFAAKFQFKIHPSTLELMSSIVLNGEISALKAERIWIEIEKALNTDNPEIFFEILQKVGALKVIFPELDKLKGVPQKEEYHPEGDCWNHTIEVLKQAVKFSKDPTVRFAALCHDLGKGETPKSILPSHYDHEHVSAVLVGIVSKRLKVPNNYKDLAYICAKYHMYRITKIRPNTILKLMNFVDAFRKIDQFKKYLIVLKADHFGRGERIEEFPDEEIWKNLLTQLSNLNNQEIIGEETRPDVIQRLIYKNRLNIIQQCKNRN